MPDNVFAQRLRYWRTRAGKSQGEVARHLGVSRAFISDVESGKRAAFTEARIVSVSHFLDIPASTLRDAKAELEGFWRLPVCGTPEQDALASYLASFLKQMSPEQVKTICAAVALASRIPFVAGCPSSAE